MAFYASSNFTINGAQLANVERDQHIVTVHGNLVQCTHQKVPASTIWDEYIRVPTGRVFIKKTIGSTNVKRRDKQHRVWQDVDARRTINIARIQGEDKEAEFLYLTYSGGDAFKAFKCDFEEFSQASGCVGVPALIFYDALVPVAHIFERNDFSPILHVYFNHQSGAAGIPQGSTFGELWVEPISGVLQTGPYVEDSSNRHFVASGFGADSVIGDGSMPLLSLEKFGSSITVFEYLSRTLSAQAIIRGIRRSYRFHREVVTEEEAIDMLSSLPGTVYNRTSRNIVMRYPHNQGAWCFGLWKAGDGMDTSPEIMEDGLVRSVSVCS
ncbi:hypothetical protein VNI00_015406 [Paramarasmius palmivorus]|uniref:Uncharacterized protein n=1 Tax=Paramarasmius palmivorus TaxID=297713 RepID=A0AAW0BKE9_9AGAR